MRTKLAILVLASTAAAGCGFTPHDLPDRGLAPVNVPVVTSADYVFDASAPGGALAPGEAERLNGWFQGLGLGYGDTIYVDGAYADRARAQVAQVAGRYAMMVTPGAPVTAGMVPGDSVRIVVARRRAEVPSCPNWSVPSQPNYNNRSMSNFGCGVNANLAAMVANPEDLLHGRDVVGGSDVRSATKPISFYRTAPQTGEHGLQDISTKKKDDK